MSKNRFSSLESTSVSEYQGQLIRFDNEINKLKRERAMLVDELKRKYKVCKNCLTNNVISVIESGTNCQPCVTELAEANNNEKFDSYRYNPKYTKDNDSTISLME